MIILVIPVHIYECPDCVLTFAVEQALEDQAEIGCPLCKMDLINDVAAGELKTNICDGRE